MALTVNRMTGDTMSVSKILQQYIQMLPEQAQTEVLDFVKYLLSKQQQEEKNWSELSLTMAMRGLEDEETLYTVDDLQETFR